MKKSTLRFLLITLAVPAVALLASSGTTLGGAELFTVEVRFDVRGSQKAPDDVVVVAIDSGTINTYQPDWRRKTPAGPQPLDRAILARFLERAEMAGARAVIMNLYFQALNPRTSASDRRFLDAIEGLDGRFAAGVRCPTESEIGRTRARLGSTEILERRGAQVGTLCILDDELARQVPFRASGSQGLLVAAAKASGRPISRDAFQPDVLVEDPLERFAWVNFYGPRGSIKSIPLDLVLEGKGGPTLTGELRDKVVVLGWTDGLLRGSDELRTFAPGGGRMYAPEFWAQAVATLSEDFPLRELGQWAELLMVFFFGLTLPVVAIFFRPLVWIPVAGGLLLFLLLLGQLLFNSGWIVQLVPPMLALGLSVVSGGLIAYLKSTDEVRDLRLRFAAQDESALVQVIGGATVGSRPAPEVIIPGYRILEVIGKGGSGTVYRAASLSSGSQVALKIIRPVLANDRAVRTQFEREIEASKRFSHKNSVHLLDGGESDGIFFTASQLARGGDLEARVNDFGPMNEDQVLKVANSIGACLSSAHEAGIIHRDIKPSNIYIDGDDYLLGDFGIARIEGDSSVVRASAYGPGTIAYAAPEQLDEAARTDLEMSPATDVYALAATLFALLTGRPPFLTGSVAGTIAAKSAGREPALDSSSLPFAEPIGRALNPDPRSRPQSIRELLDELNAGRPGR